MLSASLTLASSHSHVFFSFFGAGLVQVWLIFFLRCALLLCACFSSTVFRFSVRFDTSAGNLPETRSERQTYIEKKKKKELKRQRIPLISESIVVSCFRSGAE
jgi:hypothetical protein